MKIIFLKDIPRVGQKGQIKDVADGFGNSLIMRGVAERATKSAVYKIEQEKKSNQRKKEDQKQTFQTLLGKINSMDISIFAKANDKGHLFKAISKEEILYEIKEKTGIEIETNNIEIGNIKSIGKHKVLLSNRDQKGEFVIDVLTK